MANHHDLHALLQQLGHLDVHFGDQRASRIKDIQPPGFGLATHFLRHAVGAEDHRAPGRHLGQFLDEHRALGAQVRDHELVVHDFVAHVDRAAVLGKRALDDFDGALHPGAKAARIGEQHFDFRLHCVASFHGTILTRLTDLQDRQDLDFEPDWPARERMVEIHERLAAFEFLHQAGKPCTVRTGEFDHLAPPGQPGCRETPRRACAAASRPDSRQRPDRVPAGKCAARRMQCQPGRLRVPGRARPFPAPAWPDCPRRSTGLPRAADRQGKSGSEG